MTIKEELQRIALLDERIHELQDNMRAIAEDISALRSAWPDGIPHGGGISDPTATKAIKLSAKLHQSRDHYHRLMLDLIVERQHLVDLIDQLNCPKHRRVIRLRYVDGKSWSHVASDIGCTRQHAYRLERSAIAELEQIRNNVPQKRNVT